MSQQQPAGLCQCNGCTGLPAVREQLLEYLRALHIGKQEEVIAQRILNEVELLHSAIRDKHSPAGQAVGGNGSTRNGKPEGKSSRAEPAATSKHVAAATSKHGDPMVCDHCALHKLKCAGSPICSNCILTRVPCIRRWCVMDGLSPGSCTDRQCRYAHQKRLPVDEAAYTTDDYIVLPGTLPAPNGRAAAQDAARRTINGSETVSTFEELKLRQGEARAQLSTWSGGDIEMAKGLYYPCGRVCERLFPFFAADEMSGGLSPDAQKLAALASKLSGRR